jgi:hypothetical protein
MGPLPLVSPALAPIPLPPATPAVIPGRTPAVILGGTPPAIPAVRAAGAGVAAGGTVPLVGGP